MTTIQTPEWFSLLGNEHELFDAFKLIAEIHEGIQEVTIIYKLSKQTKKTRTKEQQQNT